MLPFNTSGSIDSTQTKLFFTHPANANKKVTFHNRRWFLIQEIQSKRLFFSNFWKYTVSKSHKKYKFLIAVDRLRVHSAPVSYFQTALSSTMRIKNGIVFGRTWAVLKRRMSKWPASFSSFLISDFMRHSHVRIWYANILVQYIFLLEFMHIQWQWLSWCDISGCRNSESQVYEILYHRFDYIIKYV